MANNGKGLMGRGPGAGGEKANDFAGTWKKLIGYCKKYIAVIVIALICAVVGTVCTLVGPDKLSDMTDTITSGIKPDTDKLTALTEAISDNISANMETVVGEISANLGDQSALGKNAEKVMSVEDISDEDKKTFSQTMTTLDKAESQEQAQGMLLSLPESVLNVLYSDVDVNGSVISVSDQVSTLAFLSEIDEEDESAAASAMSSLPESVTNALYTDITVDGKTISAADQKQTVELMSELDTDDASAAMDKMKQLPDSVTDAMDSSIDMDKIFTIGMTLAVLYALGFVLSSSQGWIMATVTQRVTKRMRSDISHKINRLPMWYFNKTSTGDVLSRVTNDIDVIGQSMNQSIGMLISAVVLMFGSLIMMLKTNGILTLTAVLASLIGFMLMFLIMGRSQKYFARQQKHLGQINGHVEEIFSGHTVVKAYNGEQDAEEKFREMNNNLRESGFRAQCLSGLMMPIMSFIGNFGYVAVCVVGGTLALKGKIGFGVIVAFMMYVRYFTQPLAQIAQAMQTLQSAAAAGERVFELLEAEEMEDESGKNAQLQKAEGYVDFSHVKFGYAGTDKTIIHDFSASAKPGQKIAIVGPTGAGKTTLINLLMRFHEIQGGEIKIDGVSTLDIPRENVHAQFCMVLQDTWLFEGTVRENLIYCTEGATDEKMEQACKAVGLDHFIRTLPNGYDTVLNDNVSLSQGQKQQLTIARAMIADKPMLILDEATSSVDTRTELQIQNAMDKLMENRTSFVIAHRLSTIKNADLILVLKDGDVIESGSHDELMSQNGFYAELYNSQFEQVS